MSRKLLFLIIVLGSIASNPANAQQYALDLFGGASNYQGDMMEKRYTMQNSKMVIGVGGSYIINGHFRLRAMFSFAKVGANDKYNKDALLLSRNLDFTTNINEFSVTAHYDFLDLHNYRFTPYIFAGLAVFHFNPYTYDSTAGKTFLKPLSTEGQGLTAYPDRKPYSLTQLSIPFGGGIRFRFSDEITLAWEIGLRRTNTDYLDDLSTTYVDQATLLAARGPLAVGLAYRGDELKNNPGTYPADGITRGGAEAKDWYYFSGITATFNLNAGPSFRQTRNGSTTCPKPVM
jgi:hypothetical protein